MKKYIFIFLLAGGFTFACKDKLDVIPPSEVLLQALKTDAGIKQVLFSAYANQQNVTPSRWLINTAEVTTDIGFNSGGAENLQMTQLINFGWDASLSTFNTDVWIPAYRTIRDANIVITNVNSSNIIESNKKLYTAEARFLRAYAYDLLYRWFGPVPIRTVSLIDTTANINTDLARATDAEARSFIESDLLAAVPDLPDPGKEEAYGRATKGMAWALLAKFYLNTKQWQKAADACQKLELLNYYQLFPTYETLFRVENEPDKNKNNKEMILVSPALPLAGLGNWYTAGALPPNFVRTTQVPEYTWVIGMANFATQYRMRSAFVKSFDLVNDNRAKLLIRTYVSKVGNIEKTEDLMSTPDNARCLKYWDNSTIGNDSGNDVPLIRYADILLTWAEALNELDGPTQQGLDLINRVRTRAGLANLTLTTDATSKDVLRDLILQERAWEFYGEGKRREDLLRHDKFITLAQGRNLPALAKHKLFPIPQAERDANPLCEQNDGY